jgi:tetratricopeptide (TPR) repeat protein
MQMNSNPSDPNQPPPDSSLNADFLSEFQGAIESYVKAVNADQTEEADRAAAIALILAGAQAMAHPTPEGQLAEEADNFLRAGDWVRAEEAYRKLLELQEGTGNPGLIAKPQMDLSHLFRLIGRLDDAWAFALSASDSARRTEVYPLIWMALENEALCALARGEPANALAAASEAVQVIEPGKMADLIRAQAHTLQAQCALACGDAGAAERDLQASWEILGSRKFSNMHVGPVVGMARWWEIQAELEVHRGNLAKASVALKQAIERRQEGFNRSCDPSPNAFAALARTFERLAHVMRLMGDSQSEEQALAEAQTLWVKSKLKKQPSELRLP